MPHQALNYAQATLLPDVGALLRSAYPQLVEEGWNSELLSRLHDYGEVLEVIDLFERCHWNRVVYTRDQIKLYLTEGDITEAGLSRIMLNTRQEQHVITHSADNNQIVIFSQVAGTLSSEMTLVGLLKSLVGVYAVRDLERLVLNKTKAELIASSITIRLEVEKILGGSLEAFDLIIASCQAA